MKRGKMVRMGGITAAVVAIYAATARAEVAVTFPVDAGDGNRNHANLTLDFSVDGSGNVTLDAMTPNGGAVPQSVVNGWDGAVGTISDSSLFNTSFSLVAAPVGGTLLWTADLNGGGLGVSGTAITRIDGQGAETLQWTFSGSGTVEFKTFSYNNRAAYGTSNLRVIDDDTANTYMLPNTAIYGTNDISSAGYSITNGQTLSFTTAAGLSGGDDVAGASLYGFSFDVIPEPATVGLIAAFGGGILFIRRRFMM